MSQVLTFVKDGVAVANGLNILDTSSELECGAAIGVGTGISTGVMLIFTLRNDALDFLFVGCLVDIHVIDIGRGFRNYASVFGLW